MCFKNHHLIVQKTQTGARYFHPPCKRYDCPSCGKRMKAKVFALICSGVPNKFLTLTYRHTQDDTPDEVLDRLNDALKKLFKRLKREFKIKSLPYFVVVELHPSSGYPHLHIFLRSKYLPQKIIKRHWEELTNSFFVHISAIRDEADAASYAAKYIELTDTKIGNHRRWRSSRDWVVEKKEKPVRPPALETRVLIGVDIATPIDHHRRVGDELTVTASGVLEVTMLDKSRDPVLWSCAKPIAAFYPRRKTHETRSQIVTNWPLDHESVVSARI